MARNAIGSGSRYHAGRETYVLQSVDAASPSEFLRDRLDQVDTTQPAANAALAPDGWLCDCAPPCPPDPLGQWPKKV